MNDSKEPKPAGYGHDNKGAAGDAVKNEGRVRVAHKAPMTGTPDAAGESTAQTFTIDDREINIRKGETIFRAARRLGIKLPHLCYSPKPGYRPDGNCRVCMVEIEGERVLAASCIRTPSPGMKVRTQTDRAKTARRMVAELLLTDQPVREVAHHPDSELWKIATRLDITQGRLPRRETPAPDRSHPAMAVNLDACIHCNLCVRACREVQVNDVIGMAGRGHGEKIVFDFDDPMGASTCVACGECVQACPTGALMPATLVDERNVFTAKPDRAVDSVCPYCGVGCQLTYHIKDDKLLYVSGNTALSARKAIHNLFRHGDTSRLEPLEKKALTSFSFGSSGFILPPEMSNIVISCVVDETDVTGLMQNVTTSAGSLKFLIDNARMEASAWACEASCFANNGLHGRHPKARPDAH
jgi:formate dehydrogenase major subunit